MTVKLEIWLCWVLLGEIGVVIQTYHNLELLFPIPFVSGNGTAYYGSCFNSSHGGCIISPSNYAAHEGKLYCKYHHVQLFKEKGNYSQLQTERQQNSMNSTLQSSLKFG
ncbi:hypothetical protein J1N35_003529 [Gossypium stocksii]|uniref:Uncharacterized protein n=1 Tax=Gossypium stocksii TaxID=47602 RepID=A0A9D3W9S0_9ROSI|nr:hypothetical protein J1N35_003529 [Gossypium stocksii]